ncbi:hypothetical protein HanRHA438_Chr06g0272801 [Helianthus annuus]|uniref:Uncharacterized protein n=1 Tax=Helianthus annuus TaxID=4232 RepID=A0A251TVM1_HELAN|nr:hypothetical protein HanXRQr2_Chr06g0263521 [Helianthus annuus]KAJ0912309.1 hypothetical protein HanRHA438_Chr06g0272801 [Helianthus annuus]
MVTKSEPRHHTEHPQAFLFIYFENFEKKIRFEMCIYIRHLQLYLDIQTNSCTLSRVA